MFLMISNTSSEVTISRSISMFWFALRCVGGMWSSNSANWIGTKGYLVVSDKSFELGMSRPRLCSRETPFPSVASHTSTSALSIDLASAVWGSQQVSSYVDDGAT